MLSEFLKGLSMFWFICFDRVRACGKPFQYRMLNETSVVVSELTRTCRAEGIPEHLVIHCATTLNEFEVVMDSLCA